MPRKNTAHQQTLSTIQRDDYEEGEKDSNDDQVFERADTLEHQHTLGRSASKRDSLRKLSFQSGGNEKQASVTHIEHQIDGIVNEEED